MGSQTRRVTEGLGLIARCDQGGLGNQTWDIFRHVRPERTLVMRLGKDGRGKEDISRFLNRNLEILEFRGTHLPQDDLARFSRGLKKVLTVETTYCHRGYEVIREAGARSILIANPELLPRTADPDILRVPTPWVIHRLPIDAKVLTHPVDTELLKPREKDECRTFYHPTAPAMLDRNGTRIVLASFPHVKNDCTVIIRSSSPCPWKSEEVRVGHVTARWIHGLTDDYWKSYPEEADAILLPRRYGGLCLPIQESAALGMPAIMTELEPQVFWPHVLHIRPKNPHATMMKGGSFRVWEADPKDLAEQMDKLITDRTLYCELRDCASLWSQARSWNNLLPRWAGLCS